MEIPTIISIVALILSIVALWQTHFAKFKIVCAVGNMQYKTYPFKHDKDIWYIPSIDIPIAVTNIGARIGKIMGLRIRVSYQGLRTNQNFEFFSPQWEVDYKKYYPISTKRFEWIDKAVVGDWMPFVVLPKQTVVKHLIFETRWEEPVLHENVTFDLEILTSTSRKWQKVAQWNASFTYGMFDEYENIDSVSGFMFPEENSEKIEAEHQINLTELHEQVDEEYFSKTGISQRQLKQSFARRNQASPKKSKRK
jgi:hypothetical protein